MKDFIKGWGCVCLGSIAGSLLGATSFFAVEALMHETGSTTVSDSRNAADVNTGLINWDKADLVTLTWANGH